MEEKTKFCNSCKQNKGVEYWTSLRESKLSGGCRECRIVYDRNRRLVNKVNKVNKVDVVNKVNVVKEVKEVDVVKEVSK